MVELSAQGATATLTALVPLIIEAQHTAEPVAWVGGTAGVFFPPDMAEAGVDLAALAIVRGTWLERLRAAERLLQSGAFGLVIIDSKAALVTDRAVELTLAQQSRLAALAKQHHAAVIIITDKTDAAPSLGSLVSLRVSAHRAHRAQRSHRSHQAHPPRAASEYVVHALKDKRQGPGWNHHGAALGPEGTR